MSSDFQTFIESVQHVPTEFERSVNLVKELDTRVSNLIKPIKAMEERYKKTRSRKERLEIRKELANFNIMLESLGSDKSKVLDQTYTLIDRTIRNLVPLASSKNEGDEADIRPIGYEMPIDPDEPKYCFCRGVSYGEMIACDNKDCPTEWFHMGCVMLKSIPNGKWYCNQCSGQMGKNKKTRRRR